MKEPEGFREFVLERSRVLLRTAWWLTGDWATAEDLVQTSLAKTWLKWTSVRATDPTAYTRQVMINTYATWRRRRWRQEVPGEIPDVERAPVGDPYETVPIRYALMAALSSLPPRQRAVIVLRYYEDLTESATAHILGCSVGTVKSQSSKALAKLRQCGTLSTLLDSEAK